LLGAILQKDEISHILNGPDYFICERMHCRLKKTDCASRQLKGIGETAEKGRRTVPYECQNCPQGNEIMDELKMGEREDKTMSKRGTCLNCGREGLHLPGRGLCWVCYNATRGLGGEAREKALEEAKKRILGGDLRGGGGKIREKDANRGNGNRSKVVKNDKANGVGHYEQLGRFVGSLVDKKQAAYGDSFSRSADVLRIYYPNGIHPDQYNDVLPMVRMIDKQFRIATDKNAFGESPWTDIAGYGILGMEKHERIVPVDIK